MAETGDLLSRRPLRGSEGSNPSPSAKPPKPGPESIVYTQEYYEGLKSLLIECNHEYHTTGTPRYNDGEFDALLRMLKRIEAKNPEWVKPDSPSQTVGAKPPSTTSSTG